jgi:hypothetical protein
VNEPSGSNKNLFTVAPLAMLAGLPEKIVALVQDLQYHFQDHFMKYARAWVP